MRKPVKNLDGIPRFDVLRCSLQTLRFAGVVLKGPYLVIDIRMLSSHSGSNLAVIMYSVQGHGTSLQPRVGSMQLLQVRHAVALTMQV